jgi:hypothetical protein
MLWLAMVSMLVLGAATAGTELAMVHCVRSLGLLLMRIVVV